MLTLIILIFLAYSFYIGARRGLALQAVYTGGYLVALVVAVVLAGAFEPLMQMWVPYPSATANSKMAFFGSHVALKLDSAFYYGVSFLFVLTICWALVRLGVLSVKHLEFVQYKDEVVNWLGAGVMNLLCAYAFLFFVLYIMAMIPVAGLQHALQHSYGALLMIRYTPVASQLVANWWSSA